MTTNDQNVPKFRPFDKDGDLSIYFGNLPHWRQPGATYFVTMRQADSLPPSVAFQIAETYDEWLRQHKIDPRWKSESPRRFIRAYRGIPVYRRREFERDMGRLLHYHLDQCHGHCVLKHPEAAKIVADALRHFDRQRYWLGDFIVMPNHVHALIQPFPGHQLETLLGSIKKYTSRRIREWFRSSPLHADELLGDHDVLGYWQKESYDRLVRDEAELAATRRYIANNPQAAKLSPGQWLHHSAPWLDSP